MQLTRIKEGKFLKKVCHLLILNQGKNLNETLATISVRTNVPLKELKSFVQDLCEKGFVLISRDRFALTLEGLFCFLTILREDLKKKDKCESTAWLMGNYHEYRKF